MAAEALHGQRERRRRKGRRRVRRGGGRLEGHAGGDALRLERTRGRHGRRSDVRRGRSEGSAQKIPSGRRRLGRDSRERKTQRR